MFVNCQLIFISSLTYNKFSLFYLLLWKWKKVLIYNTPFVFSYKQNLFFRFIQLIMYVVHIMDHIHH